MSERTFRFNPFTIKEWSDEMVYEAYDGIERSLSFQDVPFLIADDIDRYANMGYLIGEMIARYMEVTANYESQLRVDMANAMTRVRDQWFKESHGEKAPAISYFEAKVTSMYLNENKELNRMEAMLKRFKIAYDSIENKQNALKKKLDAIKFDVLNR